MVGPAEAANHDQASSVASWFREARVQQFERDGRTMIRLRGFSPPIAFVATLAVAVLIGAFASPIVAMLFHPSPVPLALIIAVGTVTVIVALFVAFRRHERIQTGREDLIIDDTHSYIVAPVAFWTRERNADALRPDYRHRAC